MRRSLLTGILLVCPLWAGESVLLVSGFEIHADRHEVTGDRVVLYTAGGMTEMSAAQIAGYTTDDPLPTPAARPEPPALKLPEPSTTPSTLPSAPKDLADLAARQFALPEGFVRSVMHAESGFQPAAVSPKGALGLMQLMPETAKTLGVDPRDPRQNAEGGAHYLRQLLELYQDDPNQVLLALAAYNAGPGAVEKYHGVPPYRETREYILRVLNDWHPLKSDERSASTGNNPANLSY